MTAKETEQHLTRCLLFFSQDTKQLQRTTSWGCAHSLQCHSSIHMCMLIPNKPSARAASVVLFSQRQRLGLAWPEKAAPISSTGLSRFPSVGLVR